VSKIGFHGEFRLIDPPHRIVSTEVFEGFPDPDPEAGSLNTVVFEERGMQVSMKRREDVAAELGRKL
jgi:hypothetical protein